MLVELVIFTLIPSAKGLNISKEIVFEERYCDELIEFADTGLSFNAFAGHIGVGKSTLYNWILRYPEFRKAKEIFTARSQFWWEETGIKGMKNEIPYFNAAIWCFNMKNRFFWRDKIQFDMTKVNDDTLLDLARVALEQIETEVLEHYHENKKGEAGRSNIHSRSLPKSTVHNPPLLTDAKETVQVKSKKPSK